RQSTRSIKGFGPTRPPASRGAAVGLYNIMPNLREDGMQQYIPTSLWYGPTSRSFRIPPLLFGEESRAITEGIGVRLALPIDGQLISGHISLGPLADEPIRCHP